MGCREVGKAGLEKLKDSLKKKGFDRSFPVRVIAMTAAEIEASFTAAELAAINSADLP
jgi:nucleoside 2-deoxyribosyltransferase